MRVVTDLHHIRKYILQTLTTVKWARFRDMRPEKVDTNLYAYHLKQLIKDGYIENNSQKGYRLSPMGLRFVDHVSLENFEPRWQPKILTMLFAEHDKKILMWPKYKQPFIGKWSLPSGKMHYDDVTVHDAMVRETGYYLHATPSGLRQIGVVEYSAFINNDLVSHTIAHIFTASITPDMVSHPQAKWIDACSLAPTESSPGTNKVIDLAQTKKEFFFESFSVNW